VGPPRLQACKLVHSAIAHLALLFSWVLPLLVGCVVTVEKGTRLDHKKSQTAAAGEQDLIWLGCQPSCTDGCFSVCKLTLSLVRSVHSARAHIWIWNFLDRNVGALWTRVRTVAQAEAALLWLSLCCGVVYPVPCCQEPCALSILLSWFWPCS